MRKAGQQIKISWNNLAEVLSKTELEKLSRKNWIKPDTGELD